MKPESRTERYTQILPLEGERLLLPAVAVGDVLNLEGMRISTSPQGWFLGTKQWARQQLPVFSFEGLSGRSIPPRSSRSRIVILRLPTGESVGVVCQGQPHLAPVNARALTPTELLDQDPKAYVLARVRIANLSALIPDLVAIHRAVVRAQDLQNVLDLPDWSPSTSELVSDDLTI